MAAPKDGSRLTSPGSILSTCTLHCWAPPSFQAVRDSARAAGTKSLGCKAESVRIRAAIAACRKFRERNAGRLNRSLVERERCLFVFILYLFNAFVFFFFFCGCG